MRRLLDTLPYAYFPTLNTEIETCKKRIRERFMKEADKKTTDDYFVSDDIFETYYSKGQNQDLVKILAEFGIGPQRVQVIDNNETLQAITRQIESFIHFILTEAGEKHQQHSVPHSSHASGPGKLLHLALF